MPKAESRTHMDFNPDEEINDLILELYSNLNIKVVPKGPEGAFQIDTYLIALNKLFPAFSKEIS